MGFAPVGGLAAIPALSLQPAAHELGKRRDESGKIDPQPVEARQFFQRLLIHVKRAVDFDLQAVPALGGAALAAHDLDALVALVDAHVIAEAAQEARDKIGEFAAAGRAVAITEHEIAMLAAAAVAPV